MSQTGRTPRIGTDLIPGRGNASEKGSHFYTKEDTDPRNTGEGIDDTGYGKEYEES